MNPTDLFAGVVPFVAVVRTGSVRGAARELGLTPSAVSKAVRKLESRLGVTLLHRTTRRVRPSPEGEVIAGYYQEAIGRAQAALDLALASQRRPKGVVRVSASRVLTRLLASKLIGFQDRYPELEVDLRFTDRKVSFAEERVDVALRIGVLEDSAATRRRWRRTRWATVASPAYLARHGTPTSIDALDAHACLRFVAPDGRPRDWIFGARTHPVGGPLVSDDGGALLAAAENGLGIVQAMDFMVRDAVAAGRLVPLLEENDEGPTVWIVTSPGRTRTPRVRALVDYLNVDGDE